MNLKNKCLICGNADTLNTQMKVKIEEGEFEVSLCDSHSEDATPKQMKELVRGKLKALEEFKKQAAEFGVTLNETPDVQVAEEVEEIVRPAPVIQKPKQTVQAQQGPKILPNSKILNESGGLNAGDITRRAIESAKMKGKAEGNAVVPEIQEIEPQTIDGPQGVPMSLPKKIKDTTGTTEITIVGTTDADLQRRAKQLGDQKDNPNAHLFVRGYNLKECPLCKTKGKVGGGMCPKCKGSGYFG